MNLVYIHGLDSDANSTKGLLLESYCQQQHPDITVHRPDLNQPPEKVFQYLINMVEVLSSEGDTVLIGSSLGGYFSTLVSNHTSIPALLLNPSTQPHITLQRFADVPTRDDTNNLQPSKQVLYTTSGGWAITDADLQWFAEHPLNSVNYPKKIAVLIKAGDELLNPSLSAKFYQQQATAVTLQAGGDHRFSDFSEQLPTVIDILQKLI